MGERKATALALVIICFSVLFFTTINTVKAEASNEARFSVTMPYSYLIAKNGTYEELTGENVTESTETWLETCAFSMVTNYTLNTPFENETVGVIVEYFQIQVDSDKTSLMSKYEMLGTVRNSFFSDRVWQFDHPDNRDKYFDTSKMGGGGSLRYNWSVGESNLIPSTSADTQTIGEQTTAYAFRAAEAVTVTVYRLGTVIFTDNTIEVLLADTEIVEQIQLEKYGEGWLYNELFSEEELSEINLLNPISDWEEGVIPEFPSWIILPLFLTVPLVGILVRKRLVRT